MFQLICRCIWAKTTCALIKIQQTYGLRAAGTMDCKHLNTAELNSFHHPELNCKFRSIRATGSHRYIIETYEGKLDLLTQGAMEFTTPDILTDFDNLFKRVIRRYDK
jgi:hypothetical protein